MQSFILKRKWILIGSILISALMMYGIKTEYARGESVYVKEGEKIVGIVKENKNQDVTLSVTAEKNGTTLDRRVTFVGGDVKTGKDILESNSDFDEDYLDLAITKVVREINRTRDSEIELPLNGDEGVRFTWTNPNSDGLWVLPALFPPLIMVFLFRGEKDKKKKQEDLETSSILNELPAFNNKLVLLLGSGLVYEESLKRIAADGSTSKDNVLNSALLEKIGEANKTNGDATDLLLRYAREKRVTDLKRMLTIISDNRMRGTNLIPKLSVEGELLWEKRKKRAEEEGKLAESKLTLPLGIMLISLLIVTAGPALLQM